MGGSYRLTQRLDTLHFEATEDADDAGQRVQQIVDVDGKAMTFQYHSDDRIDTVKDAYNRSYTFGYNAAKRIQSITDSTGRSVAFRYDSAGNLDRFQDPEEKFSYYIYQASTDPDGATPADPSATEASEHRMVRLRNHDKDIITQNVWDDLGRVKAQYLHGDPAKTWTLRYTGTENFEQDPEGVTDYYDERGRSAGNKDADGKRTTRVLMGRIKWSSISSSGEVTRYHYDVDHNLEQIDHPRGVGPRSIADSLHRLEQTIDPEGNRTDLIYFAAGMHAGKNRPQQIVDALGAHLAIMTVARGQGWCTASRMPMAW